MLVIVGGIGYAATMAWKSVGQDQEATQVEQKVEATDQVATTDQAMQAQVDDKAVNTSLKKFDKIKLGLDLQGGVNIVYEAVVQGDPTPADMAAALQMIQLRLDKENYTEAEAYLEGTKRIRVDIPGVKDPQKAIEDIGATAYLKFVDEQGQELLSGKDVKSAQMVGNTSTGITKIEVALEFNDEGKKKFADATTNNVGKPIIIMLDDVVISSPVVQTPIIDGKAVVTGNFTKEEASKLAERIEAGSLPFALEPISSNGIGAKLGMDSLKTSIQAGIIGFITILLFMLIVYRICGLAADIALMLYISIVILVLSAMGATLTLPGIAGILLSVGMAVDANVIIFARIKEELVAGKSVPAAVDAGFHKALSAIFDGNITTLIAAVVLYLFGTGLIKSFATTLGIGIIVSMFTALTITRILIKSFIGMKIKNPVWYAAVKKAE